MLEDGAGGTLAGRQIAEGLENVVPKITDIEVDRPDPLDIGLRAVREFLREPDDSWVVCVEVFGRFQAGIGIVCQAVFGMHHQNYSLLIG